MDLVLTGEIKSTDYDRVVDLDRVEFSDKKNKMDVYFEFPRLTELTTGIILESKDITINITDDSEKKASKDTIMVLNTTLYMIRTSEIDDKKTIIQFSAGGIICRLTAPKKGHSFKLRGNRNFKILIS